MCLNDSDSDTENSQHYDKGSGMFDNACSLTTREAETKAAKAAAALKCGSGCYTGAVHTTIGKCKEDCGMGVCVVYVDWEVELPCSKWTKNPTISTAVVPQEPPLDFLNNLNIDRAGEDFDLKSYYMGVDDGFTGCFDLLGDMQSETPSIPEDELLLPPAEEALPDLELAPGQ